jgi:hypothetical protein
MNPVLPLAVDIYIPIISGDNIRPIPATVFIRLYRITDGVKLVQCHNPIIHPYVAEANNPFGGR